MGSSPLPPWEDLRRDYINTGLPHRLVVRASPGIHVFSDAGAARLGARFELPADAAATGPSVLEKIVVGDISADGRRWIEISTASTMLFESFFRLIGQVSEAVLTGVPPQTALIQAVSLWETLVEQAVVLSEERQAGLFGELVFLERLLAAGVQDGVSTWVGPDRQAHDFRWGAVEFEVKTTSGAKRVHTINGVGQLQPSADCSLYLVSMQTTDAGTGGRSLPDLVDTLRGRVPAGDLKGFEARLDASGYAERHRAHYSRRRRLRSDMVLIAVGDGVPRLVPDALAALPDHFASERIGRIVYDVDVTGLGDADGSPAFIAVIPGVESAST